ncbi:cyclin n-terminal domain-containing protein 1-like [Plakobranchus ocellatus]|uniref:Cyclin n-terminal domain-containing protein 1-like n=1 Tax=Plakobranchus ocellatus TaxID=259542 RepID=A0AAV4A7M0_9GAST|nr:cyclin n-terminal domain-containing protein 1-like [Plakobranchus ocellatus]
MPYKSRQCDGIFGTPVEPLFNNEENGSNAEILQDWLINMAVMNSQIIKSKELPENIFAHGVWAQCVFLMCDRFELPHQTKFAALDIFDRFMTRHINDLYAHVQNSNSSKKKSDWACILDRVKNQAFLRILSCCQIASKLSSHYKVITVKRARKCLLEAGYSYSDESIVQSEMRVLKTLSYNMSGATCLDFIEILLEILVAIFSLPRHCYGESRTIQVIDMGDFQKLHQLVTDEGSPVPFISIFSVVNEDLDIEDEKPDDLPVRRGQPIYRGPLDEDDRDDDRAALLTMREMVQHHYRT